jgi:tetratricopeptide (TPR) repeat protein
MFAPPDSESKGMSFRLDVRKLAAAAILILVGGVIVAWVVGQLGIPFLDPIMILGATIIIAMILVCCSSMMVFGQFAYRMPRYGEMEIRFKEGMELYSNQDWEAALKIFREQMGPEMDHKRALFYGAKCCEELDDLNCVKEYTMRYLELQPKDKEAWEMLASTHKRLFEYEEAEDALKKASDL